MKKILLLFQILILCLCFIACGSNPAGSNMPDKNISAYVPAVEMDPKVFVGADSFDNNWGFNYTELNETDKKEFLDYIMSLDLKQFEENVFSEGTQLKIKDRVMIRIETEEEIDGVSFIRNDEGLYVYIIKHIAGTNEQMYLSADFKALDFDELMSIAKKYE